MNKSLILFFSFLVLAIFTWVTLSSSTDPKSRIIELNATLDDLRSYGIGNNPVEIRRAVDFPSSLRDNIYTSIERINKELDSADKHLKDAEFAEIASTLGSFAKRASFTSSTILSIFKTTNSSTNANSLYAIALLSYIRTSNVSEDIEPLLRRDCEQSTNPNMFACIAELRLGLKIGDNELEKKVQSYIDNDLNSLSNLVKAWKESDGIVLEDVSKLFYPICLYSPILDKDNAKIATSFYRSVIKSNLDPFLKETLIKCSIDFALIDALLVEDLAYTMQFDSNRSTRKEALISLISINSERSIEIAKAYGHKYLSGEVQPEYQAPHPFRKWALESSKSLAKNEKQSDL